jgi:hypothetical protein
MVLVRSNDKRNEVARKVVDIATSDESVRFVAGTAEGLFNRVFVFIKIGSGG